MQRSQTESPVDSSYYLGVDLGWPIGELGSTISSSLCDLIYVPVPSSIVAACQPALVAAYQPAFSTTAPPELELAEPKDTEGTIYDDFKMMASLKQEGAQLLEGASLLHRLQ